MASHKDRNGPQLFAKCIIGPKKESLCRRTTQLSGGGKSLLIPDCVELLFFEFDRPVKPDGPFDGRVVGG